MEAKDEHIKCFTRNLPRFVAQSKACQKRNVEASVE
jgi:hypothetical protein